ncbi:FtsX-like permease family protein [Streptomyces sp. NPDC008313]|uniref:FtsX-like permease family protein n=1 Tax=Streptomyces sp. NPDC008313 TaxID=3364826 RepID=UPI0036E227B4
MAPWVRTRLRAAPGAAVALALLVALTAALAAAFPRAVDRYEDAGLRDAVAAGTPRRTTVQIWAQQPAVELSPRQREEALGAETLRRQYAQVLASAEWPLVADRDQSSYGVRTATPQAVPDRWLPRPSGLPARVALAAQQGLARHARLREGRFPRADGTVTARTREVEAVVTAETAEHLRITTGAVIHVPGVERSPLAVRITGIVVPRVPGGAYWATQPLLRTPALIRLPGPDADTYWLGALLLAPDAAPAMLGTAGNPWRYWDLAPDVSVLTAHGLPRLRSAVAALESGPGLERVRRYTDPQAEADTDLDDVVASYERLRSGIGPLVAVAAFGTATVAAVVLLMAGGLGAGRRHPELALLRARGGSLPGIAGRLLAETAVVAVPAGAAGLGCALLAVPAGRTSRAVLAAVVVTLLACAALPVRAAVAHRAVRVHGAREDLASARPSRRRTVAELTLLVLASGAVFALRRSGTTGDADGPGGALVSAAPVLVGVIAALVLVRLYPLPLRALARPAGRLRGVVGPLSLARAARTSVSAVLPLLALLTALTTAAFGGCVLAGIADARDHAALLATGADARIEATRPLPASLPGRIGSAPGVREALPVSIAYQAKPDDGTRTVPLAGVEPHAYADLARRTGLGAFPEHALRPHGTGSGARAGSRASPLPALASPAVADLYGRRPFTVRMEDGSHVTVRIDLVRSLTPALPGSDFLVVDRSGLGTRPARPTALLITGEHLDGAALRAAADGAAVRLRSGTRAAYVDSPLQSGAERIYAAAVVAGAGYAALALLLALVRAAPERAALLARLRTMGLTRRQGRGLLVLEALPQALLAAAGGTLTGWAAVRLLSPGIDLTAVALAAADATPADGARLRADALSLLVPAGSVLLLAVGVAVAQAWWTGRRRSVTELRAGDTR